MASFVTDTFTDADGTALTAHTGELGATWTFKSLFSTADTGITILGGRVAGRNTSYGLDLASGTPPGAEYDLTMVVAMMATNVDNGVGFAARADRTSDTVYVVCYQGGTTNGWWTARILNGTWTNLATFNLAYVPDSTYAATLKVRDAAKTLFVAGVNNDAALITLSENDISAAGSVGLYVQNPGTATTGVAVDRFGADDLIAPLVPLAPASMLLHL
jgi:hypothetical protein